MDELIETTTEVVGETAQVVDLSNIESYILQNNEKLEFLIDQLTQSNELLARSYVSILFIIGVCGAVGVLLLLYKFIKSFY